jgi:predicted amidohydrolase YtcJ
MTHPRPQTGAIGLVATLAGVIATAAAAGPPDLILHGGRICSVDAAFTVHEALAIADGRVARVGSDAEVLAGRGPATTVRDLAGRFVLPGLIDSHVHPASASMEEWDHEVPAFDSITDVLAYVRRRAAVLDDGDWIVVRQVFITRLAERRYPTRAELDEAAPLNPVMFSTGPDASLNSTALVACGIDRDFRPSTPSGRVERDPASGEPTGILRGAAHFVKPTERSRPATQADRDDRLELLCRDYNAAGITGIVDRGATADSLASFARLRDAARLTVRVAASHRLPETGAGEEEVLQAIAAIGRHPLRAPDDRLRIIGVKAFLDGGMLTGSAFMREPWGVSAIYSISDPGYRGLRYIEPEPLRRMVEATGAAGMQFTAHAVGDGAVESLLDAYEAVAGRAPIVALRHCITHSNFMSSESVERAVRLGVVMDIQPVWLWLDGRTLLDQFGADRLRWFQPLRSIFAAGGLAGGGSDHMRKIGRHRGINPYDPFLGMATAITRIGRGMKEPLHPEEALSREQAIRFYTANNAAHMFLEGSIGSLEQGKLADFVILDRDVLTCPVEEIRDARVLETFLGGRRVFPADDGAAASKPHR